MLSKIAFAVTDNEKKKDLVAKRFFRLEIL